MRYLINYLTLRNAFGSFHGPLFEDDESFDERYQNVDPFDREKIVAILRETAAPGFQNESPLMQERIKATLRDALSLDDESLLQQYETLELPFDYSENPRLIFVWLWETLFPGESYEKTPGDEYVPVQDSQRDYLKALNLSDDDVEEFSESVNELFRDDDGELESKPVAKNLKAKSLVSIIKICNEIAKKFGSANERFHLAERVDDNVKWQTPFIQIDDASSGFYSFAVCFKISESEKYVEEYRTSYIEATLGLCVVPDDFENKSSVYQCLNQFNAEEPGVCFVLLEDDKLTDEGTSVVVKSTTPLDKDGNFSKEALETSIIRLMEASQRYSEFERILLAEE